MRCTLLGQLVHFADTVVGWLLSLLAALFFTSHILERRLLPLLLSVVFLDEVRLRLSYIAASDNWHELLVEGRQAKLLVLDNAFLRHCNPSILPDLLLDGSLHRFNLIVKESLQQQVILLRPIPALVVVNAYTSR